MDARREKIGLALAKADHEWHDNRKRMQCPHHEYIAIAAVRAAYEIDGVGELVEAAEIAKRMMGDYGWCRESADAVSVAGSAAARVRAAMGDATNTGGR